MVLVHKTGGGLIHIDQEIDIMKVCILAYISLEYFILSFRSTGADEYKNYKILSEQFLMYFSVEYFQWIFPPNIRNEYFASP